MKIKNYLYILPSLSLLGSCSNPNYSYSFSINDVNKANINRNLDINGTSYETGLIYEDGKTLPWRFSKDGSLVEEAVFDFRFNSDSEYYEKYRSREKSL